MSLRFLICLLFLGYIASCILYGLLSATQTLTRITCASRMAFFLPWCSDTSNASVHSSPVTAKDPNHLASDLRATDIPKMCRNLIVAESLLMESAIRISYLEKSRNLDLGKHVHTALLSSPTAFEKCKQFTEYLSLNLSR